MPPEFRHEHRGDDHVLVLSGELDLDVYDSLARQLQTIASDGRPRAVVDLSQVTFIDSTAIRALLEAQQAARDSGPEFVLKAPAEPVMRVFRVAGLVDVFRFED